MSILFKYDNTNNIILSLDYNSKNKPEDIASIIYALTHGLFLDKIVNILLEDIKHDRKQISYDILSQLDHLYIIDRQKDLIVKPLEAFEKNVK